MIKVTAKINDSYGVIIIFKLLNWLFLMAEDKWFHYPHIGYVAFLKSEKAKRLNIRIKEFDGVRVSVPRNMSYQTAYELVKTKQDWIRKNLSKVSEMESNYTEFTPDTRFSTKHHTLRIQPERISDIRILVREGVILIRYPELLDCRASNVQNAVRKGIEEALRIEARNFLPDRLHNLAVANNFKYNKVFLKKLRSKWGSCSTQNNINLNIHLMRLPSYLIDYVLVHELVHTEQKNHSQLFWQHVFSIIPEAKSLQKQLKRYNPQIY